MIESHGPFNTKLDSKAKTRALSLLNVGPVKGRVKMDEVELGGGGPDGEHSITGRQPD